MLAAVLLLTALLLHGCGQTRATPPVPAKPAQAASNALFRDVAEKAGIRFTLGHNGRSPLTILETLGGGGAFLDYDGDGWLDILLVGPNRVALYHNNRDGTFTDVTAGSGLKQEGIWQGVAVGDYDNDGWPDVYISGYRCCALYHNTGARGHGLGDSRSQSPTPYTLHPTPLFEDVTAKAGVATNLWGTSACFLDVDNDGYLDLYVCNYVRFYPNSHKFCKFNGVDSTCGPTNYDPEKGRLYHNNGNGTFTDETVKRGLADANGNALGVAAADYDGDGWIDFAVANDQRPGDLYHNRGRGFFENVGLLSGTAYDAGGNAHAGMGIDWADYNQDGKLELIVTTYQHQPKSLYAQTGPGIFSDICYTAGIAQPTLNYVGFGVKFLDYDNDGLADVMITNGHAVDNVAKTDHTTTYPQIPQLFHNVGGGRLEEVTAKAGPDFQRPIVGRGLAVGDYDNDGRPDALLVDIEGHALLLHNETRTANHWLTLKLQGTKSSRDGQGARLFVEEAGGKRTQYVATTGGSFLAANDPRVHIGLGAARQADRIVIRWPSGRTTTLTGVAADRFVTVVEGQQRLARIPESLSYEAVGKPGPRYPDPDTRTAEEAKR
jgi:hypothetical protein